MDKLAQENQNNGQNSESAKDEHENATETIRKHLVENENTAVSEENNRESLDKSQVADRGSFAFNLNKNNIEQPDVSNNENMNISIEPQLTKNGLSNIDAASIVQSIGHILRKARIAKGMSIEDVSRQLRLSVQQIEAIEKEDFDKLPGRTFLRGFIRNYANFVQLDPIPLLQLLPESAPVEPTYERTPLRNKHTSFSPNRKNSSNNRLGIIIVLFVVVLGGYFVFENSSWNKKSNSNSPNSEVKVDTDKTSVEIQLPLSSTAKNTVNTQASKIFETNDQISNKQNLQMGADIKTETFPIPVQNKPVIQEVEEPIATSSDMGNLYFKFTADSWVKVVDGKNVTILEQTRKGGSEQVITGKRPLSIVLGNASGVNLTYNDKEIDVASYKRKDGTARFTLE